MYDAEREERQAGQELIREIAAPKATAAKKKEEPQLRVEPVKPSGGLPSPEPKREEQAEEDQLLDLTGLVEGLRRCVHVVYRPRIRVAEGPDCNGARADPSTSLD